MKATNYARATYQEVYDIMTKDGKVSIFGFHTPTGYAPYQMLSGFFRQFRKYKYGGMSATLIPAAQLPADPLQISYAAGTENYIDPRDLQNPILFHGVHGNNLGQALNTIYSWQGKDAMGTSVDLQELDKDVTPLATTEGFVNDSPTNPIIEPSGATIEQWYYSAMLDPSFRKFNVMNNIRLPSMRPLVHGLATDMSIQASFKNTYEIEEPNYSINFNNQNAGYLKGLSPNIPQNTEEDYDAGHYGNDNIPVRIMSNRLSRLGWRDTFTFSHEVPTNDVSGTDQSKQVRVPTLSPLPKIMMGVLVMPPSYRVQLCFRMILTHYFEFAKFNTAITPVERVVDGDTLNQYWENYHDWLPDTITEPPINTASAVYAVSDSVDALNGEVKQTVSGVY